MRKSFKSVGTRCLLAAFAVGLTACAGGDSTSTSTDSGEPDSTTPFDAASSGEGDSNPMAVDASSDANGTEDAKADTTAEATADVMVEAAADVWAEATVDASDASTTTDASDASTTMDASEASTTTDASDASTATDASDASTATDASDASARTDASDASTKVGAGAACTNDDQCTSGTCDETSKYCCATAQAFGCDFDPNASCTAGTGLCSCHTGYTQCPGMCEENCSIDLSYFQGRFQYSYGPNGNEPGNCTYATGWMGCIGTLATGTSCGTVTATCE
jgi:hypothetical protein